MAVGKSQGSGNVQEEYENDFNEEEKGGIMMTEEDERKIKEVVSDIDYKAFYGKVMKKTKTRETDAEMAKLSPRSREIATVMRFVKDSFGDS